ncbi:unnamed protein product, partial [marine sediment metagenome]
PSDSIVIITTAKKEIRKIPFYIPPVHRDLRVGKILLVRIRKESSSFISMPF